MNISRQYYYLIAGLPELFFDQDKLPFRVIEFRDELRRQLGKDDFQQVIFLFLPFDNRNLLYLLTKEEDRFDLRGNITFAQLEESLTDPSGLPPYQQAFLEAYRNQAPLAANQSWELQLTTLFYDYVMEQGNPFLQKYFSFERDFRNLLTGISSRRHQLAVDSQYVGRYGLTEMMKKSHARDFGLANEHPYLEKLLQLEDQADTWERERSIDRLRWNFIAGLNTFNYFTLEVILGYMLHLMILERWTSLDAGRGEKLLQEQLSALTENIEAGKQAPDEKETPAH